MKTSECNGCHASIIWTLTKEGKKMPVDSTPSDRGTFTIDIVYRGGMSPVYHAVSIVQNPDFKGQRYVPHWATCPERARFRRRR